MDAYRGPRHLDPIRAPSHVVFGAGSGLARSTRRSPQTTVPHLRFPPLRHCWLRHRATLFFLSPSLFLRVKQREDVARRGPFEGRARLTMKAFSMHEAWPKLEELHLHHKGLCCASQEKRVLPNFFFLPHLKNNNNSDHYCFGPSPMPIQMCID